MATTHSNPFLVSSSFVVVALFLISSTFGFDTIEMGIPNCPSFSCGGINISYPFWVAQSAVGKSGTYCGYQELQINCTGSTPYFQTSSSRYVVKAFDTGAKTVTLADADADAMGSDCPRVKHNVNISQAQILNYAPTVTNLTFFFNCIPLDLKNAQNVSCLQNQAGLSYVLSGPVPPSDFVELNRSCKGGVVVSPVLTSGLEGGNNLPAVFTKALNAGFQLGWGDPQRSDCLACEDSKGRCGYSNSTTGKGLDFVCFCKAGRRSAICREGKKPATGAKIGIGVAVASFLVVGVSFCLCFQRRHSIFLKEKRSENIQVVKTFIEKHGPLALKRYSYADVKRMTKCFDSKLGQGGCGSVYKGSLPDGCTVAVKVLDKSKDDGEGFINEVASIGRTNHVNVVSLLGFCLEGSKRALIYEFMANGSLEKFLFVENPKKETPLGWENLYKIAVGIARGLEYLHCWCKTRIVHFDIKPHNILLDEDFCPKISDFGLAKSCLPKQSYISMVGTRGTIGYIAPEVFSRHFGVVSSKSDVYSYGMMVLEMVGGRRNADTKVDNSSESYFPHWLYEHLDHDGLQTCGVTIETEGIAKNMVLVGLWCTQTSPGERPSMTRVVDMLEGNVEDIQMPPKPCICSPPSSPRLTPNSYSTLTSSNHFVS